MYQENRFSETCFVKDIVKKSINMQTRSSIVNEVIRGNFTSIKRIKRIKSTKRIKSIKNIRSIKSIKSIKMLNKRTKKQK